MANPCTAQTRVQTPGTVGPGPDNMGKRRGDMGARAPKLLTRLICREGHCASPPCCGWETCLGKPESCYTPASSAPHCAPSAAIDWQWSGRRGARQLLPPPQTGLAAVLQPSPLCRPPAPLTITCSPMVSSCRRGFEASAGLQRDRCPAEPPPSPPAALSRLQPPSAVHKE